MGTSGAAPIEFMPWQPPHAAAKLASMSTPQLVTFAAGATGTWRIERIEAVAGTTLPDAEFLSVATERTPQSEDRWTLRGTTSNARYSSRAELDRLAAVQEGLGRPQATCAALIPIRKNAAWWALAQDERRAILEEQSRHIAIGLDYLPAVARRLHHCRELGEPFDFLTWFEYAPADRDAFEELVARLRRTPEWTYVDREVDLRLARAATTPPPSPAPGDGSRR